jgi:hypothetical protein
LIILNNIFSGGAVRARTASQKLRQLQFLL